MRAAKDKQRCFVLIVFSCTTSSNKFKLTPLVQRQAKWSVLWFCFLLSAMNDLCALCVLRYFNVCVKLFSCVHLLVLRCFEVLEVGPPGPYKLD